MQQLFRRIFRRAIMLQPVTWLMLVAVFGAFMWLNFNATRRLYLERSDNAWHGGVREGFPLPWWDAGSEASCAVNDSGFQLSSKAYGGWRPLGVGVGLLVFSTALFGTAYASERLLQRFRIARTGSTLPPLNRRIRIRLATGLVTVILLGAVVALNLVVTTSLNGPGSSTLPPFSQTMGWPFTTYSASDPVLVNADRSVGARLTKQEANAYLEAHSPLFWKRAHWSMSGIVLNTIAALLLISGAACCCEWLGRHPRLIAAAASSSTRQAAVQPQ